MNGNREFAKRDSDCFNSALSPQASRAWHRFTLLDSRFGVCRKQRKRKHSSCACIKCAMNPVRELLSLLAIPLLGKLLLSSEVAWKLGSSYHRPSSTPGISHTRARSIASRPHVSNYTPTSPLSTSLADLVYIHHALVDTHRAPQASIRRCALYQSRQTYLHPSSSFLFDGAIHHGGGAPRHGHCHRHGPSHTRALCLTYTNLAASQGAA